MMRLSSRQQLWGLLAFALVARLLTLSAYPLTDTTEARYGEIARKMLETGQWIVPQIDYGVPFWGKPPLSFWLTAISFKLIGITEFAARVPSLILGVAVCALVYILGSRHRETDYGLRASVVVATSLLMMVSAGGVMTDPAMVLGTTLSMVAFWMALAKASRVWGYAFFVGLAVGLLAKGPVATVLTLLPIGLWAVLTGRVQETARQLPWITGTSLTAFLVVPWYWAAEAQSPGFLQYFLVGEHWQRYTVSGWTGDLYGSGHPFPLGTIWLYALLGTLPWSPWILWHLIRRTATVAIAPLRSNDGWLLYLVCWMLAPVLFFTPARNILPTYVLPGLAGFSLLVAEVWTQRQSQQPIDRLPRLGLAAPLLTVVLVLVVWPTTGFQSQKEIVSAYADALQKDRPLIYFKQRPYSAQFYTRGSVLEIDDEAALRRALAGSGPIFVVARETDFHRLSHDLQASLARVTTSRNGKQLLLQRESDQHMANAPSSAAGLAVTRQALAKATATVRALQERITWLNTRLDEHEVLARSPEAQGTRALPHFGQGSGQAGRVPARTPVAGTAGRVAPGQ